MLAFWKKLWVTTEDNFLSLEEKELVGILEVFTTIQDKLKAYSMKLSASSYAKEQEIKSLEAEIAQHGALILRAERAVNSLVGLTK